jgi:hypothetical protein
MYIAPLAQAPADSLGGGKRLRPSATAPGERKAEGPGLSLVTALPSSVWQEHVRPVLSLKEAVGLRGVCKALRGMVAAWPVRLYGSLHAEKLQVALTCFPAAERLAITSKKALAPAEESRMVELLRGHGGTLKHVDAGGGGAKQLLSSAVRAGALPNLIDFDFFLHLPTDREILSGGMLPLLQTVKLQVTHPEQVSAFDHLRQLRHLRSLWLSSRGALGPAFPPFPPPSLKALTLEIDDAATIESLLDQLPSALRTRGTRLEEIDVRTSPFIPGGLRAECGDALAEVLCACSSTLKIFRVKNLLLRVPGPTRIPPLTPGLFSCCPTLEVLHCPWDAFSALPATCPTFPRLTELVLSGGPGEDIDGTLTVWDIMASGRLPALATLVISRVHRAWWEDWTGVDSAGPMAGAFEAVGRTLKKLAFSGSCGGYGLLPAGACYELGAAIGKLRRFRFPDIDLLNNGRDYHAVGRGVAASGGCPELFELRLDRVDKNLDLLACEPSLIVPSVRVPDFVGCGTEEEALVFCCGLVQMGHKRVFTEERLHSVKPRDYRECTRECMRVILRTGGVVS